MTLLLLRIMTQCNGLKPLFRVIYISLSRITYSKLNIWRVQPKKLQYIEAYCPGGSQFLRNCALLQWLPVHGFILKILSRGERIVTQRG
jgi:hypothetical protein